MKNADPYMSLMLVLQPGVSAEVYPASNTIKLGRGIYLSVEGANEGDLNAIAAVINGVCVQIAATKHKAA